MELPTYTNIWRIEKRLYKLYDFRLPMPLPVGQLAAFLAIAVPYMLILTMAGMPFSHTWVWLYVLPPGVLAWLVTRPVLEGKRLPELVLSQLRYLSEPRTWCRMAPLAEKDVIMSRRRSGAARPPAAGAGGGGSASAGRAGSGSTGARCADIAQRAAQTSVADSAPAASGCPRRTERPFPRGPVWPGRTRVSSAGRGWAGRDRVGSRCEVRRRAASARDCSADPGSGCTGHAPAEPALQTPATPAAPGKPLGRPARAAAPPDRPVRQQRPARRQPAARAARPALHSPDRQRHRAAAARGRARAAQLAGRYGDGWHDRVVVVPGGHRPGKPDQVQRDQARARLPLAGPARIVVLGCTAGAGQTVTTLLTGQLLASLRGEAVAVLDLSPGPAR